MLRAQKGAVIMRAVHEEARIFVKGPACRSIWIVLAAAAAAAEQQQ